MAIPPCPNSMKTLDKFLKRAKELDANTTSPDNLVLSYYCKKYVVEKAYEKFFDDPEVKTFVAAMMQILERDKAKIGLTPEEAKVLCLSHANRLFSAGDAQDKGGLSDKGTAKVFYTASIFYDILSQFGEVEAEIDEKREYSKWKPTDILAAIKEGRVPTAGGFNPNPELAQGDSSAIPTTSGAAMSLPSLPSPGMAMPHNLPVMSSQPSPSPASTPLVQGYSPTPQYPTVYAQPHMPPTPVYVPQPNFSGPPPIDSLDIRIREAIGTLEVAVKAMQKNQVAKGKEDIEKALAIINRL